MTSLPPLDFKFEIEYASILNCNIEGAKRMSRTGNMSKWLSLHIVDVFIKLIAILLKE